MNLIEVLGTTFCSGAVGGFANCLIAGEFVLPSYDKVTKIFRPGWIGVVLVGGIAAVVVSSLYGLVPYTAEEKTSITIAQIAGCIVIGLSGGTILTQVAQKKADELTKRNLLKSIEDLTEPEGAQP